MIVSRENLSNFVFFFCLAMFSAWAVQVIFVFKVYALPPAFFENIMRFDGFAPDQYRILPYLVLRVLKDFLGFGFSVFIFNFFSLLVLNIFLWHIFDSRRNKVQENSLVLFSFLYVVSMLSYFRPITAFVVALVSAGIIIIEKGKLAKNIGLILIVLALSFSRADIALIFSMFVICYYGLTVKNGIIIMALPVFIQVLLKEYIFPDAIYYCQLFQLNKNLTSSFIFKSPLFYFMIAVTVINWVEIKSFLKFYLKNKKLALLPFLIYIAFVLVFGRIGEFRLYLPLFPMVVLMYKDFIYQSGGCLGKELSRRGIK